MSDFFAMSGYGTYIWSAYSLAILILGLIWFYSRRFEKKTEETLIKLKYSQIEKAGNDGDET